jgi:hypothetical protein
MTALGSAMMASLVESTMLGNYLLLSKGWTRSENVADARAISPEFRTRSFNRNQSF